MAKKGDKKGKKPHKNKLTSKKYLKYSLENGKAKSQPHCPRCGPGTFLAGHKDRAYCGKCHYAEFTKKESSEEKKEFDRWMRETERTRVVSNQACRTRV